MIEPNFRLPVSTSSPLTVERWFFTSCRKLEVMVPAPKLVFGPTTCHLEFAKGWKTELLYGNMETIGGNDAVVLKLTR